MASANIHNIDFKGNTIFADVGKSGSLDCDIISHSENNNYFFGSGCYCTSEDGEDIESIFLFSKDSMIYRKKFEDYSVDCAVISDTGSVLFYTDECDLFSMKPDGNQNFKKHIGIEYDDATCMINNDSAYFFGNDDDDNISLVIFNCPDKKIIKHIISDIELEDENGEDDSLYADEAFFCILERGFFILYPDCKTSLMFNFEGSPIVPNHNELEEAVRLLKEKEATERQKKERHDTEREAFLKERQELSDFLVNNFGSNKRAAIKYMVKNKDVEKYKAEKIVDNIYSKYTKEQLLSYDKQILDESKRQFAEAREDLKKGLEESKRQRKEAKEKIKSLFSRK